MSKEAGPDGDGPKRERLEPGGAGMSAFGELSRWATSYHNGVRGDAAADACEDDAARAVCPAPAAAAAAPPPLLPPPPRHCRGNSTRVNSPKPLPSTPNNAQSAACS